MGNQSLYIFWLIITGLFVFSMVYSWFVAIIVRRSLPGELAWLFFSLAVANGGNALVRSGTTAVDPSHVVIFTRTAVLVAAVNSCIVVVMLGRHYNGKFTKKIPLREQFDTLAKAIFRRKEEDHG